MDLLLNVSIIILLCLSQLLQLAAIKDLKLSELRYCARVMYDGSNYRGWQTQANTRFRTIQNTLCQAFSIRFGKESFVMGAGRTDMGVHARGQTIHFDQSPGLELEHLNHQINRLLPDDIRIYNASIAPLGTLKTQYGMLWHATVSSTGKHYSYSFCTNSFVDPLRKRYYAHCWKRMDIQLLNDTLQHFVGTHDFKAFSNKNDQAKECEILNLPIDSIRTITSVQLHQVGDGYYRIDFHLNSALYKMIRTIVGSAFDVAIGKVSQEHVLGLLYESRDRGGNKSKPAPPEGLCLEHVYYDGY